ncbi:uncharacterized protein C16orf78 homolog isoform X5 [Acinonyx jubatus]|uniref:Uncharacterized protein C16orf78 homolog isoform X5 n=1 Tax=Acinonyx jubatus TaxID=32536 RepID=A0ABM3P3Z0_ACIJB|nr:uncharacterized protein C16orf78 homolog isoform X5 [Acinonyx jubatus]
MTEPSENLKDSMPTERKSMWRTSEERRMSDLTRVLEWLQRRQGKKKQTFQKPIWAVPPKTTGKEEKKGRSIPKKQKGNHQAAFSEKGGGGHAKPCSSWSDLSPAPLQDPRARHQEGQGPCHVPKAKGKTPQPGSWQLLQGQPQEICTSAPARQNPPSSTGDIFLPPDAIQQVATGGQQVLSCSRCSEAPRNHLGIQMWHPGTESGLSLSTARGASREG